MVKPVTTNWLQKDYNIKVHNRYTSDHIMVVECLQCATNTYWSLKPYKINPGRILPSFVPTKMIWSLEVHHNDHELVAEEQIKITKTITTNIWSLKES